LKDSHTMTDTHARFDFATTAKPDIYKLLASTVMPRPIAWITSLDAEGRVNAAPFSFFNAVSSDPPLFAVGFSGASDRDGKDTLANIRTTGELVINLVSEELADAMNITAIDAPRGTDELALAGLATAPSEHVKAPRIAASPVSYECNVFQIIETGGAGTVLLARALAVHVRHDAFANKERLYLNPSNMRLVGRMHGTGGYSTTRDEFEIQRLSWAADGAKLQGAE
jgi:flavin reductase (DIM6/NTAB) family NADH-FMN oxidoreductase RutF